jgi:chitinase
MASPSEHYWGKWINYEELIDDFDYIGFMTYSYHGEWADHSGHNSPLFSCNDDSCDSVNDSFLYACLRQIPKEKLLLGIPFFGQSFDCGDLYQKFEKSNYYGYSEVRNFIDSGWRSIWDNCAKVPFLQKPDQSEIVSFDDERSISEKCQYIKGKNVAGVIIWELSQDYFQSSSPLLKVIGREFRYKKIMKEKKLISIN